MLGGTLPAAQTNMNPLLYHLAHFSRHVHPDRSQRVCHRGRRAPGNTYHTPAFPALFLNMIQAVFMIRLYEALE